MDNIKIPRHFQKQYINNMFINHNYQLVFFIINDINYLNKFSLKNREEFINLFLQDDAAFSYCIEKIDNPVYLYNCLCDWIKTTSLKGDNNKIKIIMKKLGKIDERYLNERYISTSPDDLFNLLLQNNYPITGKDFINFPQLSQNYNVMNKAIHQNNGLIIYDKTNDTNLYKYLESEDYIPSEIDLKSNSTLCSNRNIMRKVIENNPAMIKYNQVNNPQFYELSVSLGYIPTIEDLIEFPNLALQKSIMEKLVSVNPNNIAYDNTGDSSLYLMCLEAFIQREKNMLSKKLLINTLDVLSGNIKIEDSRYAIPFPIFFEAIQEYAVTGKIDYIKRCIDLNGFYLKEYGQEMEKLYTNPDIIIGMHGSNTSMDFNSFSFSVFREGLRYGVLGDHGIEGTVHLKINSRGVKANFLQILDYRFVSENLPTVIIAIPKGAIFADSYEDTIPTMKVKDNKFYLASEFIVGTIIANSQDTNILHNPFYGIHQEQDLKCDSAAERFHERVIELPPLGLFERKYIKREQDHCQKLVEQMLYSDGNVDNNTEFKVKSMGYSGMQLLGLVASISSIVLAIFGIGLIVLTR